MRTRMKKASVFALRAMRTEFILVFAALVGILFMFAALTSTQSAGAFVSSEVQFADASASGLSIVPASCPSSPHYTGQCDPGTGGGTSGDCKIWASSATPRPGEPLTISWDASYPGVTYGHGIITYITDNAPEKGSVTIAAPSQRRTYSFMGTKRNPGTSFEPAFGCDYTVTPSGPPVDPPLPDTPNERPQGVLDAATCTADGWAVDLNTPTQSIGVHFYIDGAWGGATTANGNRPDVNSHLGISGNHGFSYPIPNQFRDGAPHSIRAYGIDTQVDNVNNAELTNSPKTFTCSTPIDHCPGIAGVQNSIAECPNTPPNPPGGGPETQCVANQGQACQSAGNMCSQRGTGTVQCNGSCNATTPSNASCRCWDGSLLGNNAMCPACPEGYTQSGFLCIAPPDPEFVPFQATFPGGSGSFTLSGHLEVRPALVRSGGTAQVYWNVTNVRNCEVKGTNGDSWTTKFSGNAGQTSGKVESKTTFTLRCTSLKGIPNSIVESKDVNVSPSFDEQ